MNTAYEFFLEHGRYPMADRGEKPWTYCGWLRVMVQLVHAYDDDVPNRWGYFQQVFEGRLPTEGIPEIVWLSAPDSSGMKQIEQAINHIAAAGFGSWGGFGRFIQWLGFGLDIPKCQDPGFSDELNDKLYRTFNAQVWLQNPYDYLGSYLAESQGSGKNWNPNAFYPTPMSICQLMIEMQMGDARGDQRLQSVMDPCVGSGRLLLVASNRSLLLYGQDIDPLMVDICNINGLLYAPWMVYSPKMKAEGQITVKAKKRPPPKKRRPPRRT